MVGEFLARDKELINKNLFETFKYFSTNLP
jgi:hypothetical protein